MSDSIAPKLREEVLERLRGLSSTRNFTKPPEEIEHLLFEKSKGIRKTYLDLFSRLLDPALTQSSLRPSQSMPNVYPGSVQATFSAGSPQRPLVRPGTPQSMQACPMPTGQPVNPTAQFVPSGTRGIPSNAQAIGSSTVGYPPSHTELVDGGAIQRQHPMHPQGQLIQTQGENYGGQPGSNPVIVRTASVGSVPVVVSQPMEQMNLQQSGKPLRPGAPVVAQKVHVPQSSPQLKQIRSGSHRSDSGRTTSGSVKSSHEPQSLEAKTEIITRLTSVAARYLPAVKHAIQMVSTHPEAHLYVRKYTKLKDILENPEANLHVIRLGQVNLIEQLLNEIERNPMHLVQQQLQHQQQSQQQQQAKSGIAQPTAAASISQKSTSDRKPGGAATQDDQLRQRNVPLTPGSQSRFRAPASNLNTLLSQSVAEGASPSGPVDVAHLHPSESFSQGKTVASLSQSGRTSSVSMSPGASSMGSGPDSVTNRYPSASGVDAGSSQPPLTSLLNTTAVGQARNFYANFQLVAAEFQKMTDLAAHDSAYSRRIARAMNEVSNEVRPLRESLGLLLPSDLGMAGEFSKKSRSSVEDDSLAAGVKEESSICPNDQSKNACDDVEMKSSPAVIEQKDSLTNPVTTDAADSAPAQPDSADSLFIATTPICSTGSTPLTQFPSTQLEQLNARVQNELSRLRGLQIDAVINQTPPAITLMESYATCFDVTEWNNSCHLLLTLNKALSCTLPCAPPPLMLRLAPDYLKSHRLNWFIAPRVGDENLDFNVQPPFSLRERDRFLELCYFEFERKLNQQLRRSTHYRITVFTVAKYWLDCICAALARLLQFDQNVFLFGS